MAVNKVVFGNTTVMDITDSTVDSDSLLTGVKAYGADGDPVIGGVVKSWTGTAAQYAQEASQIPDGTQVNILDDFTPVGTPIGIADIYSTEEREIGVWIDGKPLYQKTIIVSNVNFTTSYKVIGNIGLIPDYANISNYMLLSSNGDYKFVHNGTGDDGINIRIVTNTGDISLRANTSWSNPVLYANIQYTKTTDQPGSGKYVPSGAPAVHYSTDEQIIGTWIDGKTLYQKVIIGLKFPASITDGTTSTKIYSLTELNISNVDSVISKYSMSDMTWQSGDGSKTYIRRSYVTTSEIQISSNRTTDSDANFSPLIIQYTKTTD